MQAAVALAAHGVDGEVAPQRILDEVARELDLGVPAEAGDVAAQGRDLEAPAAQPGGHRAVAQAGRDRTDAGRGQQRHDPLGPLGRREVEVGGIGAGCEQRIAHAAADEPGRAAVGGQRSEDPHALRGGQPGCGDDPH